MKNDDHAWMKWTLIAAGIYNLLWGTWVILRPNDLFDWVGIDRPRYAGIWQCVGMIVGVYGIGYWLASRDPVRHWPITLVGLLGKLFGPIGFIWTLSKVQPGEEGYLPAQWGWTIVTNDLVWWIPFGAILYQAFKASSEPESSIHLTIAEANSRFQSQYGATIEELSADTPVLVLFLRHQGCTFCREALADLARGRDRLQSQGVTPILVHMGDNDESESFFDNYGLADVHRISDPDCKVYRAYDLGRGKLSQLFGPGVWWKGFKACVLKGHGVGKLGGDGFQMPGAFLVKGGDVIKCYRHETAADSPDLCILAGT